MGASEDRRAIVAATERWLRDVVIGLDLCPFARVPFEAGRVAIDVSGASDPQALCADLVGALDRLVATATDEIETTLLVHPGTLNGFEAYNDFLDVADALLERQGLVGTIQIASFHPDYRFADAPLDDPAHFSNRSPYPMLHLLREESVARAVASLADPAEIPRRNVAHLRALGWDAIEARRAACLRGADPS